VERHGAASGRGGVIGRREKALAWASGVGDPGTSLLAVMGLQGETVVEVEPTEQRVPQIKLAGEGYLTRKE